MRTNLRGLKRFAGCLVALTACQKNGDNGKTSSSAKETSASSAKTPTSSKMGGQSSSTHVHAYVAHEEVPATCATKGLETYYQCEWCHKYFNEDKKEIEAPVEIPVDLHNHEGSNIELIAEGYKTSYVVGEAFSLEGATFTVKCEKCDGYALTVDEAAQITIGYPTEGASSFTSSDVGEGKKVTLTYDGLSTEATVSVAKMSNAITGLPETIEGHRGFKPFASYEGASAEHGDIVYSFFETQDGEYKTAEEVGESYIFEAGDADSKTFYVKATVAEAADDEGASASATLVITHADGWVIGENEVTFGCSDRKTYAFDKTVDAALQNVDLSASPKIDLTGVSAYDSVKSIKCGDYDLGTDIAAPPLPRLEKKVGDVICLSSYYPGASIEKRGTPSSPKPSYRREKAPSWRGYPPKSPILGRRAPSASTSKGPRGAASCFPSSPDMPKRRRGAWPLRRKSSSSPAASKPRNTPPPRRGGETLPLDPLKQKAAPGDEGADFSLVLRLFDQEEVGFVLAKLPLG